MALELVQNREVDQKKDNYLMYNSDGKISTEGKLNPSAIATQLEKEGIPVLITATEESGFSSLSLTIKVVNNPDSGDPETHKKIILTDAENQEVAFASLGITSGDAYHEDEVCITRKGYPNELIKKALEGRNIHKFLQSIASIYAKAKGIEKITGTAIEPSNLPSIVSRLKMMNPATDNYFLHKFTTFGSDMFIETDTSVQVSFDQINQIVTMVIEKLKDYQTSPIESICESINHEISQITNQ